MRILAIETSCDDTGVAVLEYNKKGRPKLLANFVSSQVKIHAPWGGVVPTLAKREHQKKLVPILKQALKEANLLLPERGLGSESKAKSNPSTSSSRSRVAGLRSGNKLQEILNREPELFKKILPFLKKYQKPDIDYIAVTVGPGLEMALWVGVNFAKTLAYYWDLPLIPINHIEAHIIANWLTPSKFNAPHPPLKIRGGAPSLESKKGWGEFKKHCFPAICLVVSGGHTQIILMKNFSKYKVLGETRDDAAGEAFDKLAKMLNLGYPGGPAISRLAAKWKSQIPISNFQTNSELKNCGIIFPRPMINSKDFDFSFSGLKTAALYFIKTLPPAQIKKLAPAICAQFQQAAIDVLTAKTVRAAKEYAANTIMLAGGVASNDLLRETLKHETEKLKTDKLKTDFMVPPKNFCTDNAAIIALAAHYRLKQNKAKKTDWRKLKAKANLRIS